MEQETIVGEGKVETKDLRLASWLYLNQARLAGVTPVESNRCSFTFTLNNEELNRLMDTWANGYPTADVREVINAYLYLVHRGKEMLSARGGRR